jgi:hypothetical protein
MSAYTDADVQALMSFLAREGIACGPKLSDRILDVVAPAIVARAKAEALREHAADLMAAVADFSEISWERLNNESVARLALNRADEIKRTP